MLIEEYVIIIQKTGHVFHCAVKLFLHSERKTCFPVFEIITLPELMLSPSANRGPW